MTTQRDRLAAVLPDVLSLALAEEIFGPGTDPFDLSHEWYMTPRELADALLARGVRVVNTDTLGKALDKHECVGDWSICNHKCAQSVLDALDEMTE